MTTTRQAAEIAELAEELADQRQHIEIVHGRDKWRNRTQRACWVTTQPALLDQLADVAFEGGSQPGDTAGARPVPGSRPPGRWEALSTLTTIALEVFGWIATLGLDQADTATANVRTLAHHATHLDDDQAADVLTDLRRWHHHASVMTGWAEPTWAPAVPCPIPDCGIRTSLRIRTDRRLGLCTACHAQWTDEDGAYTILANYIAGTGDPGQRQRANRIRSGRQGHGAWLTDQPISQT